MANIHQTFTPSSGFILLKIIDEQTPTLDTVNDPDKKPAAIGKVIAVGSAKLHESGGFFESRVDVGDTVVFKPYGVDEIYLNNIEHRIVPFENIRGVLEKSQ